MRLPRFKALESHPRAYYHCVSRVVDRQFVLQEEEREVFLIIMREYEQFCGVRVLTYCLMSNHFHILVEVPKRPDSLPTAEELMRRLNGLSRMGISADDVEFDLRDFRSRNDIQGEQAYLASFFARMWDVSEFMKLVKQRYTQWHNRKHQRRGTLWESRFTSVLIDGESEALITTAAYIDLNPVRAGIVDDPKDYRWCGYAEATAGGERAQLGLQVIAQTLTRHSETLEESQRLYRLRLFGQGEEKEGFDLTGSTLRRGLKPDAVLQVIQQKGRLPATEYVRCRARYFTDGRVLGQRKFIEEIFAAKRSRFSKTRRDGARRLRGLKEDLYALRDLQVRVFG